MNTANLAVMGPTEQLPATRSETLALTATMERLARDPSVPIERIERIMDMLRELRQEQAEEEFNDALTAAQREMTTIARDSLNPQTHSKYASYAAIDKAVRPIRTKHGLAVSFDEAMEGAPEGHIRVLAFVSKGRHTRTYHYDSPIVTTGLQGKAMMTPTHARASAVTYAKRYLTGMIFDLSTGEDIDGNGTPSAHSGPISDVQLQELIRLADSIGADKAAFCNYFRIPGLAALPASQYERAVLAFKKRGAK